MMFRWPKLAFLIVVAVETNTEKDPKMAPMLWEEAKNLCHTYKEIKYLNVTPQILILKQNEELHMRYLEKSYHFRAVISL